MPRSCSGRPSVAIQGLTKGDRLVIRCTAACGGSASRPRLRSMRIASTQAEPSRLSFKPKSSVPSNPIRGRAEKPVLTSDPASSAAAALPTVALMPAPAMAHGTAGVWTEGRSVPRAVGSAPEAGTGDGGGFQPVSAAGSGPPARDAARAACAAPARATDRPRCATAKADGALATRQGRRHRRLRGAVRGRDPVASAPPELPPPSPRAAGTPGPGGPARPGTSRAPSAGPSGEGGHGPARPRSGRGTERRHRRSRVETPRHRGRRPVKRGFRPQRRRVRAWHRRPHLPQRLDPRSPKPRGGLVRRGGQPFTPRPVQQGLLHAIGKEGSARVWRVAGGTPLQARAAWPQPPRQVPRHRRGPPSSGSGDVDPKSFRRCAAPAPARRSAASGQRPPGPRAPGSRGARCLRCP